MSAPESLAAVLNLLPFVIWDRFTTDPDGRGVVYGWISRPDGRFDFVVLEYSADLASIGYTTSSVEHSEEIGVLLYGEKAGQHFPCQRVDEHFGDLVANKTAAAAA